MFYTLASRVPLISNSSNRKFFKIFLIGSIIYILLHYYLYLSERWFVLEKLKPYLYYVMVVDLAVAYFMIKWNNSSEYDLDEDKQSESGYTKDQKMEIEKNLQELRKMQSTQVEQHRQKLLPSQEMSEHLGSSQALHNKEKDDDTGTVSQKSPFMTKKQIEKEEFKKEKNEVKSKSSNSHDKPQLKSPKEKYKKKKVIESDTDINVYMGKN